MWRAAKYNSKGKSEMRGSLHYPLGYARGPVEMTAFCGAMEENKQQQVQRQDGRVCEET
jgi:hypothetical protein